eukprot:scaffold96198_cov69-Phaeocystis_antarctica.AAC.8
MDLCRPRLRARLGRGLRRRLVGHSRGGHCDLRPDLRLDFMCGLLLSVDPPRLPLHLLERGRPPRRRQLGGHPRLPGRVLGPLVHLALAECLGARDRAARALAPLGGRRRADRLALHPHDPSAIHRVGRDLGREHRLRGGVLDQPGRVAVVVVDHGVHAVVQERRVAEVARRQPAERGACHPLASRGVDELVEHLVVGRLLVGLEGHALGPRGHEALGSHGLVDEGESAPETGGARLSRLVAPEVEDCDVAWPVRPAARHEEVGELVELELVEDEGGLHRDQLPAILIRPLDDVFLARDGGHLLGHLDGLAAHKIALTRVDQALRLRNVAGRVERHPHKREPRLLAGVAHAHVELAHVDATLLHCQLGGVVLVVRHLLGRVRHGEGSCVPRLVLHTLQELGMHARARALGGRLAVPVLLTALARRCALHALIRRIDRAAFRRLPHALGQAARLLLLIRLYDLNHVLLGVRGLVASAILRAALRVGRPPAVEPPPPELDHVLVHGLVDTVAHDSAPLVSTACLHGLARERHR